MTEGVVRRYRAQGIKYKIQKMPITTLTYNLAEKIRSGPSYELDEFVKNGSCCEYINLCHYNFFYSYPEWQKKWPNGQEQQFHRVDIKCHLCDYRPERNYAGIGGIYLLNNGIGDPEINILNRETKKLELTKNTPRLSPMICLCRRHIKEYFPFSVNKPVKSNKPEYTQLELF